MSERPNEFIGCLVFLMLLATIAVMAVCAVAGVPWKAPIP